jgi:DNA replication protein DnaC
VRELAGGGFIAHQRNAVLVGGTGTGRTHFAIAFAATAIMRKPALAPSPQAQPAPTARALIAQSVER